METEVSKSLAKTSLYKKTQFQGFLKHCLWKEGSLKVGLKRLLLFIKNSISRLSNTLPMETEVSKSLAKTSLYKKNSISRLSKTLPMETEVSESLAKTSLYKKLNFKAF